LPKVSAVILRDRGKTRSSLLLSQGSWRALAGKEKVAKVVNDNRGSAYIRAAYSKRHDLRTGLEAGLGRS